MSKNLIPRISSAISHELKGKAAGFILDRKLLHDDYEKYCDSVADNYDSYIKHNKLDKSLEFNFPQYYKRLSERRRPCEIRKQVEEDKMRNKDKAIVNGFCNFFMWSQAAYKPPVKSKKK